MRLNKYLAKSGVASRRKSDELIQMATTTVNNEIILDPAYEVSETDDFYEDNEIFKVSLLCEPQYGKRGMYPTTSVNQIELDVEAMTDVICYSYGIRDLLSIA